jgi:amino acid transporter
MTLGSKCVESLRLEIDPDVFQTIEGGPRSTTSNSVASVPYSGNRCGGLQIKCIGANSALDDVVENGGPNGNTDSFAVVTGSMLRRRDIQIQVNDQYFKEPTWVHPNIGGEAQHLGAPAQDQVDQFTSALENAKRDLLSEWTATSISGNDILSSVLFSAGLTACKAGKYAIVSQCLVICVIYCFRFVFQEVMSVVPLNGGCYNAILNSSSKKIAAIAGIFSMLSYLATGVVCGVAAFNYLNTLVQVPVAICTVGMLFFFAVLCLFGIAESAIVALGFYLFHTLTLSTLVITSIIFAIKDRGQIFLDNMQTALPDIVVHSDEIFVGSFYGGDLFTAIFFGFGTAMLGVTGFESSAQYIEQQKPGVFPKTLRNMWVMSSFYNLAFALLSLAVVPLEGPNGIYAKKDTLLAHMGHVTSGSWLEALVSIDAFAVLAGAVLTSYVGITGLVQRLAMDRLLPHFLLKTNTRRKSNHFIILSYFLIASSLVLVLNAHVETLSGVFAFAFLGVLASFVMACILLKLYREEMPRDYTTTWFNCIFCMTSVIVSATANAMSDPLSLEYFVFYFALFGLVVLLMLERITIYKCLLYFATGIRRKNYKHSLQQETTNLAASRYGEAEEIIGSAIAKKIEKIKQTPVIFFCKYPKLPLINQVIRYVQTNEQTYSLLLVHMYDKEYHGNFPKEFEDIVCLFDHIYPHIKIDFVSVSGHFEPSMIHWLSQAMHIPINMMLMGQPSTQAIHQIANIGVRVISN